MAEQVKESLLPDGDYGSRLQTKSPPAAITEAEVKRLANNAGLRNGDMITIQCMNHYKTLTFYSCKYEVTGVEEVTQVADGFNNPNQQSQTPIQRTTIRQTHLWRTTIRIQCRPLIRSL